MFPLGLTELLIAIAALACLALPITALVFLGRDQREGAQTMGWIIAIVFAPFLGAIAYLIWRDTDSGKASRSKPNENPTTKSEQFTNADRRTNLTGNSPTSPSNHP
ncbi:PLD nuclease N-terminal domain-containing protein [Corynebacterium lowii]|uniref:Cardiolipin synthase n=1 Tax=Corynebacterium lowii TaxID=1544413 RepID=A0A0Q1DX71_9CORY|nr:PLD nuclease N-terminal domain-containing protein [Corynebacterium lowii]KQB84824.1 Cardiolipin synthase [Corynebacterium lowii]MDP9851728.1 hypothetical protein [Corynebacterium lowii]